MAENRISQLSTRAIAFPIPLIYQILRLSAFYGTLLNSCRTLTDVRHTDDENEDRTFNQQFISLLNFAPIPHCSTAFNAPKYSGFLFLPTQPPPVHFQVPRLSKSPGFPSPQAFQVPRRSLPSALKHASTWSSCTEHAHKDTLTGNYSERFSRFILRSNVIPPTTPCFRS